MGVGAPASNGQSNPDRERSIPTDRLSRTLFVLEDGCCADNDLRFTMACASIDGVPKRVPMPSKCFLQLRLFGFPTYGKDLVKRQSHANAGFLLASACF